MSVNEMAVKSSVMRAFNKSKRPSALTSTLEQNGNFNFASEALGTSTTSTTSMAAPEIAPAGNVGTTTSSALSVTSENLNLGLSTNIPGETNVEVTKIDAGSSLALQLQQLLAANEMATQSTSASVSKPAAVLQTPPQPKPDISEGANLLGNNMHINGQTYDMNTLSGLDAFKKQTEESIKTAAINTGGAGAGGGIGMGGYAQAAGSVGKALQSFGKLPKDETVLKINAATDAAADAAMASGNPYAMAAGAAIKVSGAINRMTGNGGVDGKTGLDKFAASDAGFIFGAMNPDPLAQAAYWVNRLTAKSTPKFEVDLLLQADQGDAYAGAFKNLDRAAGLVGKYGGFSASKRVKNTFAIEQARMKQDQMLAINEQNQDAQTAASQEAYGLSNQTSLNGGFHALKAGRKGMKINNIDWAFSALYEDSPKLESTQNTLKFEDGGQIEINIQEEPIVETIIPFDLDSINDALYFKDGGAFNVIPDGALHKNKHNMEDAEGLTKKGIPVVTEEDGKKVQQAEIEVNEIIFRLEVTEKLEELAKEGTDEAALEAGKLLVKEILHNTLDNTGLIKETV